MLAQSSKIEKCQRLKVQTQSLRNMANSVETMKIKNIRKFKLKYKRNHPISLKVNQKQFSMAATSTFHFNHTIAKGLTCREWLRHFRKTKMLYLKAQQELVRHLASSAQLSHGWNKNVIGLLMSLEFRFQGSYIHQGLIVSYRKCKEN